MYMVRAEVFVPHTHTFAVPLRMSTVYYRLARSYDPAPASRQSSDFCQIEFCDADFEYGSGPAQPLPADETAVAAAHLNWKQSVTIKGPRGRANAGQLGGIHASVSRDHRGPCALAVEFEAVSPECPDGISEEDAWKLPCYAFAYAGPIAALAGKTVVRFLQFRIAATEWAASSGWSSTVDGWPGAEDHVTLHPNAGACGSPHMEVVAPIEGWTYRNKLQTGVSAACLAASDAWVFDSVVVAEEPAGRTLSVIRGGLYHHDGTALILGVHALYEVSRAETSLLSGNLMATALPHLHTGFSAWMATLPPPSIRFVLACMLALFNESVTPEEVHKINDAEKVCKAALGEPYEEE